MTVGRRWSQAVLCACAARAESPAASSIAESPGARRSSGEFERVASEAQMIWTRELGPRMSWQAPFLGRDCDCELRTHFIDLDSGERGDDQDAFSTNELALGFEDSALDMAARAYPARM